MLINQLFFLSIFISTSTAVVDLKKLATQGNTNAMYALGNELCNSSINWEQCKIGIPYLWSAHIKNHPSALGQFIHFSIKHFEKLSLIQRKKIYTLKEVMSSSQKTKLAQKLSDTEPLRSQQLMLEAAKNNYLSAQWNYIELSLTNPNWLLNKQLIIDFLNNLQIQDNLSRLLLAHMYAQGFLVDKNPSQFRSLASTVWRKLLDEPEQRMELTKKAKYLIQRGYQKYKLNRNINEPK